MMSLAASLLACWYGSLLSQDKVLRVRGNSMLPSLPDGTPILVRRTSQRIAPGAIIAFRSGGEIVVHRVVEVRRNLTGRLFLTKGDSNRRCDRPVHEDDLVGRVVAIQLPG